MKIHFVAVGSTRVVLLFKKDSNVHFQPKRRSKFVPSRQIEIAFHTGIDRQPRRGFGTLAQVIGRNAVPFLPKILSQLQNVWVLT